MNDDEKCLLCEECYSVDDDSDSTAYGKCVRCNDLNWTDWDLNTNYCYECKEGFICIDKKCIEKKCTENCEECSTDENICNRCKIRYGHKFYSYSLDKKIALNVKM